MSDVDPGPGAGAVSVRMYKVGFGDCFLITLPRELAPDDRARRILIDCGTHPAGQGPRPIREVVGRIVADVTGDDGLARIDVVVATHRHRDHVSGFAEAPWDTVHVAEVWMPWTEDPKDPDAKKIRDKQDRIANHLSELIDREGADRSLAPFALNSLANEAAMLTLHQGFAGGPRRRFLPQPERGRRTFKTRALPGVIVHAMGPSRDPDVIRDMDPPAGESYLRMIESAAAPSGPAQDVFSHRFALDPEEFKRFREAEKLGDTLLLDEDDLRRINQLNEGSDLGAAVSLERAINGTSLMIMFSVGRAHLLFPGDAQWGTWRVVLDDPGWRSLLGQTAFYKVGHHGSHNATPREFVRQVQENRRTRVRAMISTHPVATWPNIPMPGLLEALKEAADWVVRSDQALPASPPEGVEDKGDYIEARIPIR